MTVSASASPRLCRARRALMVGASLAAALLLAQPAHGQAFQATPATAAGAVTYNRATPGVETIFIHSPTAIINWIPNQSAQNPIVFLPAGNTATFQNGPNNNSGFVVLNRVFAFVPIRFDGRVVSQLVQIGGPAQFGGTILFSSPGGIIVGSTAVFDVGNLVLTTLNVAADANGNFVQPGGGFLFNTQGQFLNAPVITEAGAQINAPAEGSYVAMVAPRVVHGGSVRVNGSAAYIGAEEVEMRVNDGLFDIIVSTGSDNANPVVHTGSTGGPASAGGTDHHRIYMVAVPKNQAITAILQGDVGFDAATDVTVENGAIVLSAGYNVFGDTVDRFGDNAPVPGGGQQASFHIAGGTISSDLFGYAVTDMFASGANTGTLTFQQDVSLFAEGRARLFAGEGETVTVLGNALVSAARFRSADPAQVSFTGGEALIFAQDAGTLRIVGNATVDASGRGRIDDLGNAGDGTGGTAGVRADDGTVTIEGNLRILATGTGGANESIPDQGGAGTGGVGLVEASSGGSIAVRGTTLVDVGGTGTRSNGTVAGPGAPGTGGTINVAATGGGSIDFEGDSEFRAQGQGGSVESGPGNTAGAGQGGIIAVAVQNGAVTFGGTASMSASAFGGIGPNGGSGTAGRITVEATEGDVAFAGAATLDALGFGGDATFERGGRGGDGTGGRVELRARTGATASSISGPSLDVSVQGSGGRGSAGDSATPAGRGGDGAGGDVVLLAEAGNGALRFDQTAAQANGIGGDGAFADDDRDGGDGGTGTGGTITAGVESGPSAEAMTGSARFGAVSFAANGLGGNGGSGGDTGATAGGAGGEGVGGTIAVTASGATTEMADATLNADGLSGNGGGPGSAAGAAGTDGAARGGRIELGASAHSATGERGTLTAGNVTGSASGFGNDTPANSPGSWLVAAVGGDISFASLTLDALATGVPGARPGSAVILDDGVVSVTGNAALSTLGAIDVDADGGGRIAAATLGLFAGEDLSITHTNRGSGHTIDVADLRTESTNFSAGPGTSIRATDRAEIVARGNAAFAGILLGREIAIVSGDIDVAAGAAIGDSGTELVDLEALSDGNQVVVGGTTEGPGYTLTDAEADRIRAGTLRIRAPEGTDPNRPPDLLVRDLSLAGGGAASGIGTLQLVTPGITRVEGALLLANAGAGDGIRISSGRRLEVIAPQGSIRVRDGSGNPAGTLLLRSNDIWIVGQGIYDQLRTDPNFAGRDAALLAGDGTVEPRGFVEANAMTLEVGSSLFVQNFGGNPDYAGLTVGSGDLVVRTVGSGQASVYAFGRRLNPDGSFTTGEPFFREASFTAGEESGGFTAQSEFNRCVIVTGVCPSAPPPDGGGGTPAFPGGPDLVEGPVGDAGTVQPPPVSDEDVIESAFGADPLIEEPVTSGGDSLVWDDCDRDDDGDCDEDDRNE